MFCSSAVADEKRDYRLVMVSTKNEGGDGGRKGCGLGDIGGVMGECCELSLLSVNVAVRVTSFSLV
jgi:hypothetical protein